MSNTSMEHTHVVFLSANDIYKLLPNDDGVGGLAEFATLLERARADLPPDAHPIVTINGDFLWRTERERADKADLMIDLMRRLGIDYVVLGNHEFDFGADHLRKLLPTMPFEVFGSNIRNSADGELLPCVADYKVLELPSGLKIGLFGVLTSNPVEFVWGTNDSVLYESEIEHAKRCVQELQSQGAQLIVGLTHTRLAKDRLIARQVPGIHLLLGGHDHEPYTMFERHTMIHKSGCDGWWLGRIDLHVTGARDRLDVQFAWRMLANRGQQPHPEFQKVIESYLARAAQEADPALQEVLAISTHVLDGTRITLRSQESNLANFVTDAIRSETGVDVVVFHGGSFVCESLISAGLKITVGWLQDLLPFPNSVFTLRLSLESLELALLKHLRKFPDWNASHPHFSGVFVDFHVSDTSRTLRFYRDKERQQEIPRDTVLSVALPSYMYEEMSGKEHLQTGQILERGPIIRDMIESFLRKLPTKHIAYPLGKEGRFEVFYYH
ncbi:hypothetical protein Poli38472_013127 [Pythium oligandrum]|uniref:5'-nucleotidase n=1 Tax=Pythium oligandrum TaxID=41045 RepID=A0A8K1C2G2_PYTOL|nr:hypothetical protein Poli38472_013127 [Pythium oligandrum]|eukprot:TMW55236.1 hypothetical protein Poli38472_013127 [Pythium oligandrum]